MKYEIFVFRYFPSRHIRELVVCPRESHSIFTTGVTPRPLSKKVKIVEGAGGDVGASSTELMISGAGLEEQTHEGEDGSTTTSETRESPKKRKMKTL